MDNPNPLGFRVLVWKNDPRFRDITIHNPQDDDSPVMSAQYYPEYPMLRIVSEVDTLNIDREEIAALRLLLATIDEIDAQDAGAFTAPIGGGDCCPSGQFEGREVITEDHGQFTRSKIWDRGQWVYVDGYYKSGLYQYLDPVQFLIQVSLAQAAPKPLQDYNVFYTFLTPGQSEQIVAHMGFTTYHDGYRYWRIWANGCVDYPVRPWHTAQDQA